MSDDIEALIERVSEWEDEEARVEMLRFLRLTPSKRMAEGHAARVRSTKGYTHELPRCRRCGRPRVFSPCRDCATEREAKHFPELPERYLS